MTELVIFVIFQAIVNLLAWRFLNARVHHIFYSLAYVIFSLLMFIYPFVAVNFYFNNFYEEDEIRCGNVFIGFMGFIWIVGLPVVLIIQFLFHWFLFRKWAKNQKSSTP